MYGLRSLPFLFTYQACRKGQKSGGEGHLVLGGDNVHPALVEIRLTDLPKSVEGGLL